MMKLALTLSFRSVVSYILFTHIIYSQGTLLHAETSQQGLPHGAVARLGNPVLRHKGRIASLAFSPDGRFIYSAGEDQIIHCWDAVSRKPRRQYVVSSAVKSFSISTDGANLAAGLGDGTIMAWETDTGRMVWKTKQHKGEVFAILFSPRGKSVVSGGRDGAIHVWDGLTGKRLSTLLGHGPAVLSLAFSPDGKQVFSAGLDKFIRFWDLASGKIAHVVDCTDDKATELSETIVYSLAVSPDGTVLVGGVEQQNNEKSVRYWDMKTRRELKRLPKNDNPACQTIAFSPDGKMLATAESGRPAQIWDPASGKLLGLVEDSFLVQALCFSPDGRTLAIANDRVIHLWDIAKRIYSFIPDGHSSEVLSAVFSHDGAKLATFGFDSTIRTWDLFANKQSFVFKQSHDPIDFPLSPLAGFTYDSKKLIIGKTASIISIIDADDGNLRKKLSYPRLKIWNLETTPDGRRLVIGTAPASTGLPLQLRVVDLIKGDEVSSRTLPEGILDGIALPPPLGSTSKDELLALIRCHPTGHYFVSLTSGKEWGRMKEKDPLFYSSLFPYRSSILAIKKPALRLSNFSVPVPELVELPTGRQLFSLNAHRSKVTTAVISPDGITIATSSHDRTICLWEIATGQTILCFNTGDAAPKTIAFSPNCKRLASGMTDGLTLLWDLSTPSDPGSEQNAPEDLEKAWGMLRDRDARKAYQAVCWLSRADDKAVEFLSNHLKPCPRLKPEDLQKLIADLDNDKFSQREEATRTLAALGTHVEAALREALTASQSVESHRRISQLLKEMEKWVVTDLDVLRCIRAVWVLQRIGTPDASTLLEKLALGAPDARQTQEAKAALQFIKQIKKR